MKSKNTLGLIFLFFMQTSCMELVVSKNHQKHVLYIPQDIIQTIVSNFDCQEMSRFKRVCKTFDTVGHYWMINPTTIQAENIDLCTNGLIHIAHEYATQQIDLKKIEQQKNFVHLLQNESEERKSALKLLGYDENISIEKTIDAYCGIFTQTEPEPWVSAFNNNIIAKVLCSSINPNIRYDTDLTMLEIACHLNRIDLIKLLLNNPKLEIGYPFLGLFVACQRDYREMTQLLLNSEKINPNMKIMNNITALQSACYEGHTEIVKLFLANDNKCIKIDLNIKCCGFTSFNLGGYTALDVALQRNHTEIAELLITKGASRNRMHVPQILLASGIAMVACGAYALFKK